MMNRYRILCSTLICGLGLSVIASWSAAEESQKNDTESPKEKSSVTQHSIEIAGETVSYTATAGTILLKEEQGKAKAAVFFVAYTKNGVADLARRPITFAFNGGPGSSSVWLHMGLLGPRRVKLNDDGSAPPPPYQLVENEYSPLDITDLVMIDPVSTGYSRATPGEDPKQYHGYDEDIESVGEFIRIYTSRQGRWLSPKFLIGESYGTTRAAGLSGYLQNEQRMYLNGIVLVSSVLDFQTLRFNTSNDLPYILFLPSYTATAWYHKRLAPELQENLQESLDEVSDFALGQYALALMQGNRLSDKKQAAIAKKLSRYTGLSVDYIKRSNLRVDIYRFTKELLRDERRTVGRFDSRFTGIDRDAAGENFEYDPSAAVIDGPFAATFNDYVRRDLEFDTDLPYEVLTSRVRPWNFDKFQNRYVDASETLRQAIARNPALKVFVANGYYDLATPFKATEYTFDHLGLDRSHQDNIKMGHYKAGHMMYINLPSLKKLRKDLVDFYEWSVPPRIRDDGTP